MKITLHSNSIYTVMLNSDGTVPTNSSGATSRGACVTPYSSGVTSRGVFAVGCRNLVSTCGGEVSILGTMRLITPWIRDTADATPNQSPCKEISGTGIHRLGILHKILCNEIGTEV